MKYYLRINEREEGPFTDDEVEDLHGVGKITKSTPCRSLPNPAWKTVDDYVPRAKWVTTPHGIPPKLSSEKVAPKVGSPKPRSSTLPMTTGGGEAGKEKLRWHGFFDDNESIDFGRNAIWAGIACLVLQSVCSQAFQGMLFGVGGILCGIAATILGRVRGGILILVGVAVSILFWEYYNLKQLERGADDFRRQMESIFR